MASPHRLWIPTEAEYEAESWLHGRARVVHPPGDECKPYSSYSGTVTEYECGLGYLQTNCGLDYFFAPDWFDDDSSTVTRLAPGLYEVVWHSRRINRPDMPDEWDEEVNVLAQPQKPSVSDWPELSPPESHQLWVWMGGAPNPHYELRGTGALL